MRLLLLLLFCSLHGYAATLPDGGTDIWAAQQLMYSGKAHGSATHDDHVTLLTNTERGNFWQVQLLAPLKSKIDKGALIVLQFEARCLASEDESSCGWVTAYLQRNGAPYNKFIQQRLSIPQDWKTYTLAAYADNTYAAEGAALGFGAGQAIQQVAFRNIRVLNYHNKLTIADIPLSKSSYQGRAADAAWRGPAQQRIDEIRRGDLHITLHNNEQKPLSHTKVRIRMLRHQFPFGAALNPYRLLGNSVDDQHYQQHVLSYFNAGTFENALKWGAWDEQWHKDRWNKQQTIKALHWCKEHDIAMRGHVIVWPSWKHLPKSLVTHKDNPQAIKQAINAHIDEITTSTKDLLMEWDVVNEPFSNHDLMDICGNKVMVEWFQRMRERLPDTPLAINDYGIITVPFDNKHVEHYYKTISYLIEQKAPIDVIGIQGHFNGDPPSIQRILAQLDRFADLGLKIRITEFDIDTHDEDLQADFTRDLYTAAFSHPAVIGIQNWGFWSKAHWRPRAAWFRDDWTPKPNALAYKKLVHETWATHASISSDAQGRISLPAFWGRYEISIDGYHSQVIEHTQEQARVLRFKLDP